MAKYMCSLLIVLTFTFVSVSTSKLNVPRVLLPIFNDFNTNFTLNATDGGCYKWSTTRLDIIKLSLVDENKDLECSSKVLVITVTKEEARNLAVVLAEDVHSKQMLRCDVIVDVIHSLSIVTTTRELFMEEAPETFEIRAYDDQGNEFSTLDGVEFDWNIVSLSSNKYSIVLRYIKFKDSPYDSPPSITNLEDQNKKGYMVLLEGVKTGSSKVSVKLPYREYKHVEVIEVQLIVVANLILTPAEVYVMAGDVVVYKLYYMNNGRMEEISLPDAQYYLETEDKNVAMTDKKQPHITALKEGKTRILLHDRNIDKTDPNLKLPSSTVHVVKPEYLVINILPHRNWAVLIGDEHDVLVEVYSKNDHKLHLGSGVEIHTTIPEPFHVEERSKNGSWVYGWGVKEGVATIQATLISIEHPKLGKFTLDTPVSTKGDLLVYNRIVITPSEVILPWNPQTKPKYDVDLVATGGDGKILWSSSDNSIGTVTQTGHVHTHSHGFFEVSAAMMRNHNNRQTAKFLILPPTRLEIVEFVMEGEVGQVIHLHVALFAEKPGATEGETFLPFTMCQELSFKVKPSDTKFVYNKSDTIPPVGVSCGNVAMVALEGGTTKVTVAYDHDGSVLEDSVTLSAYRPLRLLEPKRDVILAVGSSVNLVFVGGPKPSLGRPSGFSRIVVSQNDSIAQTIDVTNQHTMPPDEEYSVVNVLCRQLGQTEIKITISNSPTVPKCKTKSSQVVVRVVCAKPRKIMMQPEIKVADVDSCPMDLSADRVVVQSNLDIELDVAVYDEVGRRFLNFSSLMLQWTVEPKDLATFPKQQQITSRTIQVGTVEVAHKNYQVVQALKETGLIQVNVTVKGYNKKILGKNRITSEWPEFLSEDEKHAVLSPIFASIGLYLVQDAVISPKVINIFNHPKNVQKISVKPGSGYYELILNEERTINARYAESTKEIEITPLRSGEVIVQLRDLCLVSKPSTLLVNVVSVGIIRVEMSDKVEIGKCITCILKLYDDNDNLMNLPELSMIDINFYLDSNIVNVHRLSEGERGPFGVGEIHYIVTGTDLGDTKITFSTNNGNEEVSSAPADLQVFPPLKLFPRNGTILIGSVIQLSTKGGPKPESTIEYNVVTEKKSKEPSLEISDKGVVTGKLVGKNTVLAKSIGIHPTTGQRVVYSEDSAVIQVIQLTGIKLSSPLTRFKVGGTVPCWVFGAPEKISPMILGTIVDDVIRFEWSVEDPEIVEISDVFENNGVTYKHPDQVGVRIKGLIPGKTKVSLKATLKSSVVEKAKKESVTLVASLDFEVFMPIVLVKPEGFDGRSLLMAPFSSLQLETNLDSYAHVTFSFPGDDVSKEGNVDNSLTLINEIITVSSSGLVESYGILGHAMVVVIATNEFGLKQTISFVVEVKPVFYMALHVASNWLVMPESKIHVVPLGAEFELEASFYDNIGNKFDSVPSDLRIKTSRCDSLKVKQGSTNSSVHVASKKPGYTMMKAWAEGIQKTADYIKVHVEQIATPNIDFITTGDIICFFSPPTDRKYKKGSWSSSDQGLVIVDKEFDICVTIATREGLVILTNSLLPAAPIHVEVLPVSKIDLLFDETIPVTNKPSGTTYSLPIVLKSDRCNPEKSTNLIQGYKCKNKVIEVVKPTTFKCFIEFTNSSIDVNTIFNLESNFVQRTGQYACQLEVTGDNGLEVATLDTNIRIWVSSHDEEVISAPANVTFIPSVYVLSELLIDESTNTGILEVVGLEYVLKEVTVKPYDNRILYVKTGYFEDKNLMKFQVQLIDYHWKLSEVDDVMLIILNSPLTNQTCPITVKVSGDSVSGHSPLYRFLLYYRHILALFASTLVILLFSLYVYSQYMKPVVNVNVQPNRSLLSSGCKLHNTGLCGCLPRSPTTMSPTPYYLANMRNSPSPCAANRSAAGANEPVYGDVSSFYNTSPDVRRNKRFL